MSATVGVCTVAAIAIGLVVANKWFHERKKRRTKEENAERARLWAEIDKKRIERATWWREETLRRLNQCEDRAKVTAMEQQRLEQAGDVVDALAQVISKVPAQKEPRFFVNAEKIAETRQQSLLEMQLAAENFIAFYGTIPVESAVPVNFAPVATADDYSRVTGSTSYTGSGGSFDGGGSSGDYSSSSSSDSSTSSSGAE